MNPDVDALISFHVNVGLRQGTILGMLQVRDEDVICLRGWNANPELATMVRERLPAEFFLTGAAQVVFTGGFRPVDLGLPGYPGKSGPEGA